MIYTVPFFIFVGGFTVGYACAVLVAIYWLKKHGIWSHIVGIK